MIIWPFIGKVVEGEKEIWQNYLLFGWELLFGVGFAVGLGFCLFVGILFAFLLLFCSVEMVLQCCSVLFCMQAVTRTCYSHLGTGCLMLVGMTLPSLATFLPLSSKNSHYALNLQIIWHYFLETDWQKVHDSIWWFSVALMLFPARNSALWSRSIRLSVCVNDTVNQILRIV